MEKQNQKQNQQAANAGTTIYSQAQNMALVIVDFYYEGEKSALLRAAHSIRNARRRHRYERLVHRGVIHMGVWLARRLREHHARDWHDASKEEANLKHMNQLVDDLASLLQYTLGGIVVSGRGFNTGTAG